MLLAWLGISWSAHADLLDNRLASFAKESHRKAEFTETYTASYLNKPVMSEGRLEYQSPGLLTKTITSPVSVIYTVSDGVLRVKRGTDVKQLDLSTQPEIGLGINALLDLLRGNRASLEKQFWVSYQIDERNPLQWKLTLIPRDEKLVQRISRVSMDGESNLLKQVTMDYGNGDSLVTRIRQNE